MEDFADNLLILVIGGRNPIRIKPLKEQLDALKLPFRLIPAVYASAQDLSTRTDVAPEAIATMAMTPGEIGCALAHQHALATAEQAGAKHTLILEDDVELSPRLPSLLKRLAGLPSGYDVILLSRAKISRHEYARSSCYYPVRATSQIAGIRIGLTRRIRRSGASAYLVSASGVAKLREANNPVVMVADDWPHLISRVEILQTSPLLAFEDYLGRGSEIQHERSAAPLTARHLSLRKKTSLLLRGLLERLAFALLALRFRTRDPRQVLRKA